MCKSSEGEKTKDVQVTAGSLLCTPQGGYFIAATSRRSRHPSHSIMSTGEGKQKAVDTAKQATAVSLVRRDGAKSLWLGLDAPPPPTEQEQAAFDREKCQTPLEVDNWRLPTTTHALSLVSQTTLRAVQWKSGMISDDLPSGGLCHRLKSIIENTSKIPGNLLRADRTGEVLRRCAQFVDGWDLHQHAQPNLENYKGFGLVPVPLGKRFHSGQDCRRSLIRVACAVNFIDRFVAAERFYEDPMKSWNEVAEASKNYSTSLEEGKLIENSHEIYLSAKVHGTETTYRYCVDALKWRTQTEALIEANSILPREDTTFGDFGDLANKFIIRVRKADEKTELGKIEANLMRICWSLVTLFALTSVGFLMIFPTRITQC